MYTYTLVENLRFIFGHRVPRAHHQTIGFNFEDNRWLKMTMGHVAQCGALCAMWCNVCDVVRCHDLYCLYQGRTNLCDKSVT